MRKLNQENEGTEGEIFLAPWAGNTELAPWAEPATVTRCLTCHQPARVPLRRITSVTQEQQWGNIAQGRSVWGEKTQALEPGTCTEAGWAFFVWI